jgi:O-antigen/teichoic acid export membrane protein
VNQGGIDCRSATATAGACPERTSRRVLGGTLWLGAGTAASQACAALLFVIAARQAGPQEYGVVVAATGLALVGSDVVDFGMNLWILAAAGRDADEREVRRQYQRKVWVAVFVSLLAGALVGTVQAASGRAPDILCLVPLLLAGHLAAVSGVALAVWAGRPALASGVTFTERFAAAVVGLALLAAGLSATTALVLGLLAGPVAAVALLATRWQDGARLLAFRLRGIGRQWRRGAPFAASDLASDVIQLHVVIVGAVAGAARAGDYSAATRLMAVFVIATSSLCMVLLPQLSRAGAGAPELFHRSLATLVGLVGTGALLVVAVAPWIVRTTFGPSYSGAVPAIQAYCLVVVLVSVGQPLSGALQAAGRQRLVATTEVLAILPSMALVGLGAWRWQAAGAAAGAAVALLPVVACYLLAWRGHVRALAVPAPHPRPRPVVEGAP